MNKILNGLLAILLCGASWATMAQVPGSCQNDVRQFCDKTNGSAVDCLLDHQQQLSDQCYDGLKQQLKSSPPPASSTPGANHPPQGPQACKSDAERFCNGVQPGGGRIVRCLMDHSQELSDGCYDLLASRKKKS
jgi:hypothetical protein